MMFLDYRSIDLSDAPKSIARAAGRSQAVSRHVGVVDSCSVRAA